MGNDIFVTDGQEIENINIELLPDETFFLSGKKYYYNFVGVLFLKEMRICSFPKHFNIVSEQELELDLWMNRILKVLNYYDKSYGMVSSDKNIVSNLPVDAIRYIIHYYKKYGFYMKLDYNTNPKNGGKPDFLTTIRKSEKVISGNNLIFTSIYSKKKQKIPTLLTEYMFYALDYVNNNYADIFGYINLNGYYLNKEYIINSNLIIKNLHILKTKEFKDINKRLISSLISFFKFISTSNKRYYFYTTDFDHIWEKMVESYLNNNFSHFDNDIFVFEGNNGNKHFEKKSFEIGLNDSGSSIHISIDHYCEDDNIYIFDSKYFKKVEGLNYKQVAYALYCYQSLKDKEKRKIINALICPTDEDSDITKFHIRESTFHIDPIYEIYLPLKKVVLEYIERKMV